MLNYDKLLDGITVLMRNASRIMLDESGSPVHKKDGHYNYVTDADVHVQRFLIDGLSKIMPNALFFAEEQKNGCLTDKPTFIIDPIDGTLNFMRGRRHSAISVALLTDRQTVVGAIYDPYADEMFTAISGCGAFLNGAPISASKVPFEKAMVAFGTSPYNSYLARRTLNTAHDFLIEAGDLRRAGAASLDLCDIACGRADVFFELTLSPWDYAAGALIVTEAGGKFALPTDNVRDMRQFGTSGCVLATNAVCFDSALNVLKRNAD